MTSETETGTKILPSDVTPDVEEKSAISPLGIVIVVVVIVAILGFVVYNKTSYLKSLKIIQDHR